MWFEFAQAVIGELLFLYAPGFLFFRGIGFARVAALCCAPLFSLVVYCAAGALLAELAITASAVLLASIALLVACGFRLAGVVVALRKGRENRVRSELNLPVSWGGRRAWLYLAIYVIAGGAVGLFLYAGCFDGAFSSVQTYDNIFHYGLVRSYAESGLWSVFDASLYLEPAADAINPVPGDGYYPAAWHILAVLMVDSLSVPVSLAVNATNFVFSSVVFPLGMFPLMARLFSDKPVAVLAGAFCSLSFASFPWSLLMQWPLYPNAMSLSIFPLVACCFMSVFDEGVSPAARISGGFAFLLGLACFAFSQPNSAFTAAVFLAPFCLRGVVQVPSISRGLSSKQRLLLKGMVCAGFVLVCVAIWLGLCAAPFLRGVVEYYWPPIVETSEALKRVLGVSFAGGALQPAPAVLVIAGVVYAFVRRRHRWLVLSYALACVIFVASASLEDTPLKHILSGFWYTDPYRVGAFAAVFAMPLASLGAYAIVASIRRFFDVETRIGRIGGVAAPCVVAMLYLVVVYYPNYGPVGTPAIRTAFGDLHNEAVRYNYNFRSPYDTEEASFVEKVKGVVPEDALILNQPFDGSLLSYSISGLNVYERYISGYGEDDETAESRIIRQGLSDIESNAEVRSAVEAVGAEYLILLQDTEEAMRGFTPTYQPGDWLGISSIDDDTPGFEVVLAEGDMRLYRITV